MRKICVIATAAAIYTTTGAAAAAPFYSTTMEATNLYFVQLSTAAYTRPESNYSNFWSFCSPRTCEWVFNYSNPPDIVFERFAFFGLRLDENPVTDGSWATSYVQYALEGDTTGPSAPNGSFYSTLSADANQLAAIPMGSAAGILLVDRLQSYATPGNTVPFDYSISAALDATALPSGYAVSARTYVYASFFADWEGGEESSSWTKFDLFEGEFDGSGSLTLQLSRDLADYNVDPRVLWGNLDIHRVTFITLVRSPVTEPGALGLMAVGLLAIRLRRWRLRT